jgi:regulatory protein
MDKNEALQRSMKLCSTKEYAPLEISQKITDWGLSSEDAETIVNSLIKEKFIDEYRFARFFVNDKIKFNKWGKIKITILLRQKGVSKEAIEEALQHFSAEEYNLILTNELTKKLKSIKTTDKYIIKGKLFQFGTSRGFESDLIYKLLNKLNLPNTENA